MTTTVQGSVASLEASYDLAKWLALPTAGVGSAVGLTRFADKTVQVTGNFGGVATVTIKGSNDGGTTWFTCHDPQGGALTFSAANGALIAESPERIRPEIGAGDGTTSINVYITAVRKA